MGAYLAVAIGSAIGGVARHAVSSAILRFADPAGLPWWTVLINVTGSFAIGYCARVLNVEAELARAFLMTGVMGGFTTFSAFSLQTLDLARTGAWSQAALNVVLSVVLCLVAVTLGFMAGKSGA